MFCGRFLTEISDTVTLSGLAILNSNKGLSSTSVLILISYSIDVKSIGLLTKMHC